MSMTMRHCRLGLVLLLPLAVVTMPFTTKPARAETFQGSAVQVGAWELRALTRGRNPHFDACVLRRVYSDGFTLYLSLTAGGNRGVMAAAPTWGLKPDVSYPTSFTIGSSAFTFTGHANNARALTFAVAPEFFAELKSGLPLSISANQRYFTINLDGVETALARQDKCVREYDGRTLVPAPVPQPAAQPKASAVPITALVVLAPPRAIYPASSKLAGEQGEVIIDALVDTNGLPSTIVLQRSSGYPALDDSAIDAVKGARFRPYSENGKPRPVTVRIPIRFQLQ